METRMKAVPAWSNDRSAHLAAVKRLVGEE